MKIKTLSLVNFRGIKSMQADLNGKNAVVKGANGTGKTTFANAISYLLTDAPITGEKDFSPKTAGEHNLNHIVEMTVIDDEGTEMTLKKDFHEVWKKKRGAKTKEFSGHEVTYEIDCKPVKKKEFDATIEHLFRGNTKMVLALSHVGYFAETMPQTERRQILFDICGDMTDDEVIEKAELTELKNVLLRPGARFSRYTPEDYLQIAKAKRRELNKKLDEYPARIDELKRTIPTERNEEWLKQTDAKIAELEKQKAELLATTTDAKAEALKAAIAGAKIEIEKDREKFLTAKNKATEETQKKVQTVRDELEDANETLWELRSKHDTLANNIEMLKKLRYDLLQKWDKLKEKRWNPKNETCPTCGQLLPTEKIQELRKNFMLELAKEKAYINEEGKQCSKTVIAAKEEELEGINRAIDAIDVAINEYEQKIETLKGENESNLPKSYEDTIEYAEKDEKLYELEDKLKQLTQNTEKPDTTAIDSEIETLQIQKAEVKATETTQRRIAELEAEQKATANELDETDKGIHLCEEFFRAKISMVSENVSKHFKNISFLLFKEQINGGLKECCEPMIPNANGNPIEYKMANTAAQVNAGLEIIKVLSDHYNVHLPVIVDRAESVTNLLPLPEHQVISLVVSAEDKELKVELCKNYIK